MTYKVLSLDGGGTRCLAQVRALMELARRKDVTGHEVLSGFDLVAATSGGSVVLGALVENLPLNAILDLLVSQDSQRKLAAPTPYLGYRVLRAVFGIGPKYSLPAKLAALKSFYPQRGSLTLPKAASDIKGASGKPIRLLMTAFDYDRKLAHFFRSEGSGRAGWGYGGPTKATLAEAVNASGNAPVLYWDRAATLANAPGRFWDGGVAGCNNPVLAATAEAIAIGVDPRDLAVLSIGSGVTSLPLLPAGASPRLWFQQPSKTGLVNDLSKLATAALDDPPDIATWLAYMMTGGPGGGVTPTSGRVVRMNPMISPVRSPCGSWRLPQGWTETDFARLLDVGFADDTPSDVGLFVTLVDDWIAGRVLNQPVRMDGDTHAVEIGQGAFAAAHAAWRHVSEAPTRRPRRTLRSCIRF